ncbi:hypothetical protein SDC9_135257 [bioreactor metagenome]|uniref:Uncharacterized protein n=1 Tax=bioreactor metagenome TaxID=1076179 RepID=A0A645DFN3_9ZZZZ
MLAVDVQEGGDPTKAHCGTILLLGSSKEGEVEPLDRLLGIRGRLGDIKAVGSCHLLELGQASDLLAQLLAVTDDLFGHGVKSVCVFRFFLLLNEIIDTVQRDPAVVSNDPASSIRIW